MPDILKSAANLLAQVPKPDLSPVDHLLTGKDSLLFEIKNALEDLIRKAMKDPSIDQQQRQSIEKTIPFLFFLLFADEKKRPEILQKRKGMPSKEEHFCRNTFMPAELLPASAQEAIDWGWDGSVRSDCHQFTSPDRSNVKYVSPDGKLEVIFSSDGQVVTSSEDYGTYNFSDPSSDPIGHFYQDVLPWLIWGNDENDSTDLRQRMEAFVVYGGAAVLVAKLEELNIPTLRNSPENNTAKDSGPAEL